jgi:hypothetical protein
LRSLPARSLAILTRDSLEEACRKITRIVNILRQNNSNWTNLHLQDERQLEEVEQWRKSFKYYC